MKWTWLAAFVFLNCTFKHNNKNQVKLERNTSKALFSVRDTQLVIINFITKEDERKQQHALQIYSLKDGAQVNENWTWARLLYSIRPVP